MDEEEFPILVYGRHDMSNNYNLVMDPLETRQGLASDAINAYHSEQPNLDVTPMLRETPGELDVPTFELIAAKTVVLLTETAYCGADEKPLSRHRVDTIDFAKLLRKEGVDVFLAPADEGYISEQSSDVHLPAILVSAQHILTNPETIKFILKAAWDYVKGALSKANAFTGKCKLDISVVHSDRSKVKVEYEGPASGLPDVEAAIKTAAKKQS